MEDWVASGGGKDRDSISCAPRNCGTMEEILYTSRTGIVTSMIGSFQSPSRDLKTLTAHACDGDT